MTKEEMQKLLDLKNPTAEEMLQIGRAYLRGEVLRDLTAAGAWLEKAVEQETPPASAWAMSLLATRIYGGEFAISEEDYQAMKKDAEGKVDTELEILLQIAEQERKKE